MRNWSDSVECGNPLDQKPDVTFFFATKIVSTPGYVKLRMEPKFQGCDYKMHEFPRSHFSLSMVSNQCITSEKQSRKKMQKVVK